MAGKKKPTKKPTEVPERVRRRAGRFVDEMAEGDDGAIDLERTPSSVLGVLSGHLMVNLPRRVGRDLLEAASSIEREGVGSE